MGRKVCAILLVLTFLLPVYVSGHGDESHEEGNIVDVLVLDLNCEGNQTCVNRPSNFVEYFGADWCTNCPQVEALLEEVDYNETLILSHRPSYLDAFWLNDSRYRFLETYRLYGYPSVILDGHYLFAGPTQTQDLSNKISSYNSNYSAVTNIELVNNSVLISGDLEGLQIDIWTVNSSTQITNMAVNHTNYTETNVVDTNGDKLVITVSQPGYISIVPGSNLPANDYNPDIGLENLSENKSQIKGSTIVVITILLLMISLPSLIQLLRLMRNNEQNSVEEE